MPEGDVSKTQMGTVYVEQEDGSKVIPGSRRPDGTMRKPVRVKEGYTPTEENKYESMGAKMAARSAYPPGFAPPEEPTKTRIPGLPDDFVEQNNKAAKKKKNKAEKKANAENAAVADEAPKEKATPKMEPKPEPKLTPKVAPKEEPKKEAIAEPEKQVEPEKQAEPEKRLKNVKKKLNEIDTLLAKPKGSLSEDQQKKVATKAEFEAEVKYLEKVIAGTARGIAPAAAKEAAKAEAVKKQQAQKKKGPAEAPVVPVPVPVKVEPVVVAPAPKQAAKAKKEAAAAAAPPPADAGETAKRIRNVKKKLTEIEKLEAGKELSEDQKAKVGRKKELQVELKHLEKALK